MTHSHRGLLCGHSQIRSPGLTEKSVPNLKHGQTPTTQVIWRSTGSPGTRSGEPSAAQRDSTGTKWSLITRLHYHVDSSAFNTIVPSKLVTKLRDLGLNSALCDWILNFLTGRPQAVRMGSTTSSTLTLNTGAPQGCVLSPLLYSLFMHDCVATHSSNTIIKFADDTTVIGLITGDDETAYREEVRALTSWCQDNNLQLNVSKTKELIVDFRRRQREEHTPISINGTTVERVNSFRFLGVHISEDLTWTHHTDFITKSARQRLFFLLQADGGSTWTQRSSAGFYR
ncbi:hypothetical protein L3Q82_000862 [Scortum barcoo]|uniref:Uncharacterized protein n=1 Tax=Scortum barcoo TaxID=214431 RepID=A0ACB8WD91_9TELE|nr:hypothetical protein L3Q82_000862 [Scortum barcoo]